MTRVFRSFYSKLSLLFLVLLVALGVAFAAISIRSFEQFVNETEQKLNRNLAADLAVRLEPLVRDEMDDGVIKQAVIDATGINPRIDVYLLDPEGGVMANYLRSSSMRVARRGVDLSPIHRFLAGEGSPILGTDPATLKQSKPFSVSQLQVMGKPNCFLYVILGSSEYDSVAGMVRSSYILKAAAKWLAVVLAVTGLVGLALFFVMTRRLRAMQQVVASFALGDLGRRVDHGWKDEFGELSTAFNAMASTIQGQVDRLRQVDNQRRELVANVSHDLRSPLASMQGYIETIMIKEGELSSEDRRKYLEVVLRNSQSLSNLVDELFELSKLDAKQIDPQFEPFSVAELLQDIVLQFRPEAARENIELEADFPEQLGLVVGDIGLVERAITNLVDNAIRYTPPGGRVTVRPSTDNEFVKVEVADTGPGIPPDELPLVFDRFFKGDRSRNRSGSGLGLAIARKLIQLHGSDLHVESRVGEGSCFAFRLPVWKS